MEPPVAQTVAIAFSNDLRVITLEGRMSSARTPRTISPMPFATSFFWTSSAGTIAEKAGEIPRASNAQAIVFAVNWPPHAPKPGLATSSRAVSSSSVILPAEWAPIASKTSRMVTSRPS